MQVVAKKHHIDIHGQIPDGLIKIIEKKYGKKNVTVIDDDFVDVTETEFYKKMKAERTPGRTLRAYRQRDNLTQAALAKKAGVYAQNISNMEKGSRTITVELAKRFAEIFGASYKIFL